MGNKYFSIIYDGAEERRIGKARLITQWSEAMKYLRVCWQGEQNDVNCCEWVYPTKDLEQITTYLIILSVY